MGFKNLIEIGNVKSKQALILKIKVEHVVPCLTFLEATLHLGVEQIRFAGAADAHQHTTGNGWKLDLPLKNALAFNELAIVD